MKNAVIEINRSKVSGTPIFALTRVPIKNIFEYLEGGDSLEDFLEDCSPVTREQVVTVLEMAEKSLLKLLLTSRRTIWGSGGNTTSVIW